jgi:pyridoxamine 5'-phosphate oxidase
MDITKTLEDLRVSYQSAKLDFEDCSLDPIVQFNQWLQQAIATKCDEPNAFVLSTVKNNQPHARVVLLKGLQQDQFLFYTNYESSKGLEITQNNKVAMTFLWLPLHRQVRIEGTISKVSDETSDNYFQKRPRGSQLGAIASPQSQKVADRKALELLFSEAEEKFKNIKVIPRPANWGGYAVKPSYIEFWQGRDNRMHDRISYEKIGSEWKLYRLAP